jgi:hypothetical protein
MEDLSLRAACPSGKPFGSLLLWGIFAAGLTIIVKFAFGTPAARGPGGTKAFGNQ